MNKTRRSRGGFLFTKKNKSKKNNSFSHVNPLKLRANERKKKEENKKKANEIAKGLEQLGFLGGRRTRKLSHKYIYRK